MGDYVWCRDKTSECCFLLGCIFVLIYLTFSERVVMTEIPCLIIHFRAELTILYATFTTVIKHYQWVPSGVYFWTRWFMPDHCNSPQLHARGLGSFIILACSYLVKYVIASVYDLFAKSVIALTSFNSYMGMNRHFCN